MRSCALGCRWKMYLAFVLVCQTARWVGGHPLQPETSNVGIQDITDLIRMAYENGELLRTEQWLLRQGSITRLMQRDTSKQQIEVSTNDETSVFLRPQDEEQLSREASSIIRSTQSNDNIIFPTDNISSTVSPLSCDNSMYCENVPNYPKQLVNEAIARNASLRFLGSIDPLPDIEQRIDAADDFSLCQYQEQVIYPQTARNKENQWLFVVNQENLKQGVRIEVCIDDGKDCDMIQDFAEGYKTTCKQKYIYRELAAVGRHGNIFKDSFRFPSSCCCHVRFMGEVRLRFGTRHNQTSIATPESQKKM
ncbi:hypothetical protein HN011_008849 [Eciton burchellii]|nr:hypothetical protein HN011_008849 [Eciton burchellii]